MKKVISLAAAGMLLAGSAGTAAAQVDVTFGASSSFTVDFNDPDLLNNGVSPGISENQKLYGSREQDESLNIDLIQLGVSAQRGIVMVAGKIDLGDLARLAGDDEDGDIGIQEAYIGVDAGFATITVGRFGTPIGYEVLEPWANANISRSRAWSWQPINHDGVTVSRSFNIFGEDNPTDFLVGGVNSFRVNDQTAGSNNPDDEFGVLGAIVQNLGDVSVSLAGIWSEENDADKIWELNGIVAGNCGNCRWGLESTYFNGDDKPEVIDVTGYAGLNIGRCTADARVSWTNEDGGFLSSYKNRGPGFSSSEDTDIFSVTLTGGYWITDGVQVRIEGRYDNSSDIGYFDDDDTQSSNPDDDIFVAQGQIVWTPNLD